MTENVPTGELPRHVMLSADRALVGAVVPGTRVTVTGVYSVVAPSGRGRGESTMNTPYIRVVGINIEYVSLRRSIGLLLRGLLLGVYARHSGA